jgi:hypothetical protein
MQSEITTIYTIVHGDEKTSQAEIQQKIDIIKLGD